MGNKKVLRLTITALLAGLSYVAFTYLKINIPTPAGSTAFHLGNTFCVLGALLLGGPIGGLAGAIGMSIADIMDPRYIMVAPKTMILKFMIGVTAGFLAHKVFNIRSLKGKELTIKVALSALGGMLFNVAGEPLFGYFYYKFILNMPEKAASTLMKFNAVTTMTNAILAVIISTVLYLAIAKRLKNSQILKDIGPKANHF
ncbi:MAG: ECF transporter S component [Erysipelotrichaceae bacterium]|nr:ECF transporter S component [Erysipelotrichaceae bacterium]